MFVVQGSTKLVAPVAPPPGLSDLISRTSIMISRTFIFISWKFIIISRTSIMTSRTSTMTSQIFIITSRTYILTSWIFIIISWTFIIINGHSSYQVGIKLSIRRSNLSIDSLTRIVKESLLSYDSQIK